MLDMKGLISKYPIEFQLWGFITMILFIVWSVWSWSAVYHSLTSRLEKIENYNNWHIIETLKIDSRIKLLEDNNVEIKVSLAKISKDLEYIKILLDKK